MTELKNSSMTEQPEHVLMTSLWRKLAMAHNKFAIEVEKQYVDSVDGLQLTSSLSDAIEAIKSREIIMASSQALLPLNHWMS